MKKASVLFVFMTIFLYSAQSIDIDLSNQKIYAKEDGRIVFSGKIASGKIGHETPTGSYTILDKERFHISNMYPKPNGGAKMPYMHRLTNTGIAIHQGYVPNYPVSHGCIRVTRRVAKKLWRWSKIGTEVRVYGSAADFLYAKKRYKKRYRRYTKRRAYKKRRYKSNSKIRIVKLRYSKKRRYHKRRYTKRYYKRRRHYARASSRYSIININDD